MAQQLKDYWVFWREFRQNFHTTGAFAPSGRSLAKALCRYVRGHGCAVDHDGPRRVLEVGPGTGAVTSQLVCSLGDTDQFDMVELNEQFVRRLNQRFAEEASFRAVAERSRVLHQPLETLPVNEPYDLIVSGLPLNNFTVETVENLLDALMRLLRPGGTLSFFEYIAIRNVRSIVSGQAEKVRLRGISQALGKLLKEHEIRRDWVWPNLPPAWVHHVRQKEALAANTR